MRSSISQDMERIIDEKKTVTANRNESSQFYSITANEEDTSIYSSQVITPILSAGDTIGAVIILSKEQGVNMGNTEVKVAETAASFLAKQMEQ